MKILVAAALLLAVLIGTARSAHVPASAPIDLSPVNVDSICQAAPAPELYRDFGYIYLLDKGDTEISADFTSIQTLHSIALVTGQDGIGNLGTEVVAYEVGHDSVVIHKALVTSVSGVRTPVATANIMYDIRPSNLMANDLYTHERQVRIVFPGLEIGSLVELQYSLVTYAPSMNGVSYRWSFSLSVPSRFSLYSVAHPTTMKVNFKTYNSTAEPSVRETSGITIRTWLRSEIPAQISEPNGLPFWDLAEHVDLTTYDSWVDFGKYLCDSLWRPDLDAPLDSCERSLFEELSLAGMTPRDRVTALFHGVQQRIRYLGLSIGGHNLKPYSSAVICKARYGDCKDQANLLVKLLRQAGIECYPAIVATWERIFAQDTGLATVPYFNHALVYIPNLDGQPMWLDATSKYAATGWVAPVLTNRWALVLNRAGCSLRRITTTPEASDLLLGNSKITLDTLGTGIRSSEYRIVGRQAAGLRSAISTMNQQQRGHLCDDLEGSASVSILDCELQNLDTLDSALVLRIKSQDELAAEATGGLLLVASEFSILRAIGISDLRPKRNTDLHLPYLGAIHAVNTCDAPEGYRVRSMPASTTLNSENVSFEQVVEKLTARSVRVSRSVEIKAMHVPRDKYGAFRDFLQSVDRATNDKLIFEKVQ